MRLIDADAMKEWIDEYVSVFKKSDNKDIKGYIEHQPTIDLELCEKCGRYRTRGGRAMRLIDADALIDRLDYCVKEGMGSTIAFTFKHMVDEAPTIEPMRGEWKRRIVDNGFNADWVCSECGYRVKTDFVDYNFCPNCGADMRGESDGNKIL